MPFTSLVTEEEQVAKAVEPIGRLIGIGRPGEPLPELGAKREYLADSDWMPRVVELLEKSQLVLVRVGTSEGIAWEIREAFKRKRPSAIVILLSISQSEYEDLAPELSEITLTRLPNWTQQVNSTFPLKAIIAFNEAGVGTLTPLVPSTNRWEPITPSLRAALEPVCRANGLPWVAPHSRLWYSTRTISYIVAFSVLLVILVRTCGTSVPK